MHQQRFFFNLGAIVTALTPIVGAVAFGGDAVKGVGLGIGIFAAIASFLQVVVPSSPPAAAREP